MKYAVLSIGIMGFLSGLLPAASLMAQTPSEKQAMVRIELRNNSPLPKQFTVVSYEPGTAGNGTRSFFLFPRFSKSLEFREGTKLFLVNQTQIDTVMSGNPLTGKPWYVVTTRDHKTAINLYRK
jgi:hypothetical protein